MQARLSHISIVVPDLEAALTALRDVYGLCCGAVAENRQQGVRLAYVDLGNARIELMEPLTADSGVGRFLAKHPGGGLHHLCLGVETTAAAIEELRGRGVRVLGDGSTARNIHGHEIAFLHPGDFFGALVELEQNDHTEAEPHRG